MSSDWRWPRVRPKQRGKAPAASRSHWRQSARALAREPGCHFGVTVHRSQAVAPSDQRVIRMGLKTINFRMTAMPLFVAASVLAMATTIALPADQKNADKRRQGVPVIVTKARNNCFRSTVRANGILKARAEAMVFPPGEGLRVTQIAARPGDQVKAGQTLAELSRPDGATITLRAPVNGTIIGSNATHGALASSGAGAASLGGLPRRRARASAPPEARHRLRRSSPLPSTMISSSLPMSRASTHQGSPRVRPRRSSWKTAANCSAGCGDHLPRSIR